MFYKMEQKNNLSMSKTQHFAYHVEQEKKNGFEDMHMSEVCVTSQ